MVRTETGGLAVSTVAAFVIGIVAVAAVLSESQAILLDGLFTFVAAPQASGT